MPLVEELDLTWLLVTSSGCSGNCHLEMEGLELAVGVRWDFSSVAITALRTVESPENWAQAGSIPFKCVFPSPQSGPFPQSERFLKQVGPTWALSPYPLLTDMNCL